MQSASIMVVDDDYRIRTLLGCFIRKMGHHCQEVQNGVEALRLLESQSRPDLLLLDVCMPELDGWETYQQVRRLAHEDELPVVVLSAQDDAQLVSQFIEAGVEDFLSKPFEPPLLRARINASLARRETRLALRQFHRRMARDLASAARIQRSIFPALPIQLPGHVAHWEYRPCDELAGDSVGFFRLDESHYGFYILDVSGHGVPAALLAVSVSRVLRPTLGESILKCRIVDPPSYRLSSPAEVGQRLNEMFPMDPASSQFFTLIYALLNVQTREVRMISAGHPLPLLLSEQGIKPVPLDSGFPIGWTTDATYEEGRFVLEPGDRLLLYTDGLLETPNVQRCPYGSGRLKRLAAQTHHLPLPEQTQAIMRAVVNWAHTGPVEDDLTILGLAVE